MRKFLSAPERALSADSQLLSDLIYGWGNESWSALNEYLAACISHALQTDGEILECGSGLSTLLVGAAAKYRGARHVALEHNAEWADRVRKQLARFKIDSVTLVCDPLKDYGEFVWYDMSNAPDVHGYTMVICDGPPGTTKGGRYGLVPIMREKLRSGAQILLDDAGRAEEQEIAARWQTEMPATCEFIGKSKPFIKITVE